MLNTLFPLVETPPSFLSGHPAEHGIDLYVFVAAPPAHAGEMKGRYPPAETGNGKGHISKDAFSGNC